MSSALDKLNRWVVKAQAGVHTPLARTSGNSAAGQATRSHASAGPTTGRKPRDKQRALDEHKKVLGELRAMKKPDLPKSELEDDADADDQVVKASGGPVIGHTRSGKPVNSTKKPDAYSDFSKEDHADAAGLHFLHGKNMSHARWHADLGGVESHNKGLAAHVDKHKLSISSKPKVSAAEQNRSASRERHAMSGAHFKKGLDTLADWVAKAQKTKVSVEPHPDDVIKVDPKIIAGMNARMKKKPKEGKRVPKKDVMDDSVQYEVKKAESTRAIGKTSSGKSIFHSFSHSGHAKFTPADHKDAAALHHKIANRMSGDWNQAKKHGNDRLATKLHDWHKHASEQAELHATAADGVKKAEPSQKARTGAIFARAASALGDFFKADKAKEKKKKKKMKKDTSTATPPPPPPPKSPGAALSGSFISHGGMGGFGSWGK